VAYRPARVVPLLALALSIFSTSPQAQLTISARADIESIRAIGSDTAASFLLQENVTLKFSELSTISALEAVADGTVPMALSARGMHPGNLKEADLVFVPIAWEAIVAITHPGNPVNNVTLRQLRDIYAGRIKTWDQIGGRAQPIHLVAVAGPMDGIEYGLRKALFGRGHIPVAAERWYLNTLQLEAAIAIDPNGLAVSGLSNVLNNTKIKRLTLEGVTATRSNVKQGEYLLVTPIYVVHRADEGPTGPVGRYLSFLRTDRPSRLLMQRKKLLPVREAHMLNENFANREQRVVAMLETPPELAAPVATTTAPATNRAAASDVAVKPALPAAPQPAETAKQSP
jgi:phosphate transport system substrate-binding protein